MKGYGTLAYRRTDEEESKESLVSDEDQTKAESAASHSHNMITIIIASISIIIITFAVVNRASNYRNLSPVELMSVKILHQATVDLSIATSNIYGDTNTGIDTFAYPFLQNALLLEPYRENTVTITNPLSECQYYWQLSGPYSSDFDQAGDSESNHFTITPTKTGQYTLIIEEICDSDAIASRSFTSDVVVKYVRRELSSLNDDDREEFLDAFHTLWTTSTVDGQELYGDAYKSLYYFASLHNDAGANAQCDEFHGGYGFINNHIYLSAYLEQSLQLVNPRVALHYMEYTKYFEDASFKDRKLPASAAYIQ
jgi:hypothetical protein